MLTCILGEFQGGLSQAGKPQHNDADTNASRGTCGLLAHTFTCHASGVTRPFIVSQVLQHVWQGRLQKIGLYVVHISYLISQNALHCMIQLCLSQGSHMPMTIVGKSGHGRWCHTMMSRLSFLFLFILCLSFGIWNRCPYNICSIVPLYPQSFLSRLRWALLSHTYNAQ